MSWFVRSLLPAAVGLLSVTSLFAQEVYIASGSGGVAGTLYKYDVGTGQQISAVPITNAADNGAIGLTGLAFNPVDGQLYGVSVARTPADGNTVGSALLTINPSTGVATVLGALVLGSSFSQLGDIAFAPDGTLYGWEARTPFSLAEIQTFGAQAGHMTTIGNSGIAITTGGGLALSPTDSNTFYASVTGADPSSSTLDTVNRQTGTLTTGPVMTGQSKFGSMNAMAFFGNTLYAVNSSQDPNEVDQNDGLPDEIHIVTINLVNGAVNDLFRVPIANIDAMAFAPIPEPSTMALLITGAAGVVAAGLFRRRK